MSEEILDASYGENARVGIVEDTSYGNVRTQSKTFKFDAPQRKTQAFATNPFIEETRSKSIGGKNYLGYSEYSKLPPEYKTVKNTGTTVDRFLEPTNNRKQYFPEVTTTTYQQPIIVAERSEPVFEKEIYETERFPQTIYQNSYPEQRVFADPEPARIAETRPVETRLVETRPGETRLVETRPVVRQSKVGNVNVNHDDFIDLNDPALIELCKEEALKAVEPQAEDFTQPRKTKIYKDEEVGPGLFCGMCVAPRKKKQKEIEKGPPPQVRREVVETRLIEEPREIIRVEEKQPVYETERVTGPPARVIGYREEGKQEILPYPIESGVGYPDNLSRSNRSFQGRAGLNYSGNNL